MTQNATLNLPTHVGLILDGNRRWARAHGLPPLEGHRKGYENLKTIARAAFDSGVKYVSAYIFSTENWNRSKQEVAYLMKLLRWVLQSEVEALHREGCRVLVMGTKQRLSKTILRAITAAEEKTAHNKRGTLVLCLDYGGQQEIADAAKQLVTAGYRSEEITPELVTRFLYQPEVPSLDLLIRTSGEQRISNFMLWRANYSELLFVPQHWPDFTPDDLQAALREYTRRQRRFGS